MKFSGSRRRFILAGATLGGGLLIGYGLFKPRDFLGDPQLLPLNADEVALSAWLKIAADGTITVAVPRVEMGQGVHTALPMLIAEELDADWTAIKVTQAPIAAVYGNIVGMVDTTPIDEANRGPVGVSMRWAYARLARVLSIQITGGSSSVRDAWLPMRTAGATARLMLLEAAALRWNVKVGELSAHASVITHTGSGRTFKFGELAGEAAKLTPPTQIDFKSSTQYTLLGKAIPRVDIPAKTNGAARFGVDTYRADMLFAAIKASPVFGGVLKSVDEEALRKAPGVVHVVKLDDAVAVIAETTWHAQQALNAAAIEFDGGAYAKRSLAGIFDDYARAMAVGDFFGYEDIGDARSALTKDPVIQAEYRAPLLAHACLEPMNCTVRVDVDGAEIWCGNQAPDLMRMNAAHALSFPQEKVTLHTPYLGGGFGHRPEPSTMLQAIKIAQAVPGRTVKLTWSRAEDLQHDTYRPPALARFKARLDASGNIAAWLHQITSPDGVPATMARWYPQLPLAGPDRTSVDGAAFLAYAIANRRVEHCAVAVDPLPIGVWRSVGHSTNLFFVESFMDELALAAARDPIDFRLRHLTARPRESALLERLREISKWDTALPSGRARGVAFGNAYGSIVGQVAEVSIVGGALRVHRVLCVLDCGRVINPDIVAAQLESGIIFGLTAALYGEVHYDQGRIKQNNFGDYRLLSMADTPEIITHLIDSDAEPGGVGEVGTPAVAPAVANAIAALTGSRLRSLPLRI
ncbi:MAG: xanthine dehydrogenase family protein molybdopterin-binding subunit [Gammaproteobacteria bacterium]|nr:xanthine dehydrogenase family protein molybdopterin-binding subunit [Gammaproteobacteria bacterium]